MRDWRKDTEDGRRSAYHLMNRMRSSGNPTLLGHRAKAIVGNGMWTGFEVGFFHCISEQIVTSGCCRCIAISDRCPDQP